MTPQIIAPDKYFSSYRNVCCVYHFVLLDPTDPSRFLAIHRPYGIDFQGTVEIGATLNLEHKWVDFKYSFLTSLGHDSEGRTLGYIFETSDFLKRLYGSKENLLAHLRVLVFKTRKDLILVKEAQHIGRYIRAFGDVPPTNGKVPGKPQRLSRVPDRFPSWMLSTPGKLPLPPRPTILGKGWRYALPGDDLDGLVCVYLVHVTMLYDHTRFAPIIRVDGTDLEAIYEIGFSTDLGQRMSDFRSGVRGTVNNSEGLLLRHIRRLCRPFRRQHGTIEELLESVLFSYIPMPKGQVRDGERKFMGRYVRRYSEPPLLNSQIPSKK